MHIFEEDLEFKNDPAPVSFEGMIEKLKSAYLEDLPQFLLCILQQRKKSYFYGLLPVYLYSYTNCWNVFFNNLTGNFPIEGPMEEKDFS